jgi:WD40 repeat protein
MLAASWCGGVIVLWDTQTTNRLHVFPSTGFPVKGVAFSPDSRWLAAAGGEHHSLRVWSTRTFEKRHEVRADNGTVWAVRFTPDGRSIATAADTIKLWDAESGREVESSRSKQRGFNNVEFSSDGKLIAGCTWGSGIPVWDARTHQQLFTLNASGHVAFTPDGQRIITSGNGGRIHFWDSKTGREVFSLQGPHAQKWGVSVAISRDGRRIASSGVEDDMRIWFAPVPL